MRRLAILLFIICLGTSIQAQYVPQALSYQAVARDQKGLPITNEEVVVEISILKTSPTGTVEWQEVHYPNTNEFGLFSINIGKGESTYTGSQTSFANIKWTDGPHYVKIRVDFGSSDVVNSFLDMGTVELQSVPYALVADSALKAPIPPLSSLSDVNAATVQTGQVLMWTGTEWLASDAINDALFVKRDGTSDLTGDWTIATNSITLTGGTFTTNQFNLGGTSLNGVTIDPTLATVNHTTIASSEAIKTYIDNQLAGGGDGWTVNATSVYNLDKKIGVGITPAYKFHAEVAGDAFIIQGDTLNSSPNFDPGTYMGFLAGKGAFRAGSITKTDTWDEGSVGKFSAAFGKDNKAGGTGSVAFGLSNYSDGSQSVVFGLNNSTVGHRSLVSGSNNTVVGEGSATFGNKNDNQGIYSLAVGENNTVIGINSIAFGGNNKLGDAVYSPFGSIVGGINCTVLDSCSLAIGNGNKVNANSVGSIASGKESTAGGKYTFAHGANLYAFDYLEVVIGQYNKPLQTGGSSDSWVDDNHIFTIGNGDSEATRSNAFVVFKNGNVEAKGALLNPSDRRLKKQIIPLQNSLNKIKLVNGVNYYWDKNHPNVRNSSSNKQIGVIAQEIEKVFPELVRTDGEGYKSVNYTGLIPVLVEAIKEQQKEIESLKASNQSKDDKLGELNDKYKAMNKRLELIEEALLKTAEK